MGKMGGKVLVKNSYNGLNFEATEAIPAQT